MNARRRLSRLSSLSFSMPDVSEAGYSPSPGFYPPAHGILEEHEEEEESERRSEPAQSSHKNARREGYGVVEMPNGTGDRNWTSTTDPVSGFVFFVDSAHSSRPHPNGYAIPPSNSSSSLSSTTSLSHPPPITSSPRPHHSSSFSTSLPPTPNDAFFSPTFPAATHPPTSHSSRRVTTPQSMYSSSAQPSPTHSEDFDGFFASESFPRDVLAESHAHCPSPSPSEGWLPKSQSTSSVGGGVGRRVRRRWQKMVWGHRGGSERRTRAVSHGLMPSDSVPNLSYEAGYPPRHPAHSVPPSPPHGELQGSRGLPLEEGQASIISVRVSLKPHPHGGRSHRHWNLEKLGIVPARALGKKRHRSLTNLKFAFKNHYPPGSAHSSSSLATSLVVRGILPSTPASLTSQLQPGDTILAVNGHAVSLDNANSVVRSLSDEEELVFIVKKRTHHMLTSTPAHHHLVTSSHHNNLVWLVSGKHTSHHHHSPPHLLLYLTLDTKEDDPADKDIVYCYPRDVREGQRGSDGEREQLFHSLLQLRGVFVTLGDVMASITNDQQSCSTMKVRDQLFHVAHIQQGKEVLLLALPATILPPHLLLAATFRLSHTLTLLHSSLDKAFSEEGCSSVDHVLGLLFHQLTSHSSRTHQAHHPPHCLSISPLTGLAAAHRELFLAEVTMRVSEALDELEAVSSAPLLQTGIAHSPRNFLSRGSLLFYKGQLVVSHLLPGETVDVATFCQAYRLLEISAQEPRASIVIWREVHLQRERPAEEAEMRGQVFLLLVGLDHMLIGLVMEKCGLPPEATPTLDPIYVSEAKQLIARLDLQDIFDASSTRGLGKSQIPPVESLDRVLTVHLSTPHRAPQSHQPRRLSLDKHSKRTGSDSDDDEAAVPSLGPRSMTLPSFNPWGKKSSKDLLLPPVTPAFRQNYTLTAGEDNILLHFLALEVGQGAWLGPTHHTSLTYGTLHSEMIACFHATCSAIRELLLAKSDEAEDECDWDSDEEEEVVSEQEAAAPAPSLACLPPAGGGQCVEHGVLLEVPLRNFATEKQLKSLPPLCYWVVGRLFPDTGRELYLCYEENISQTTVEMAFKLLFACPTTTC